MELIIKGEPEEIAVLVCELRYRPCPAPASGMPRTGGDSAPQTGSREVRLP